MQNTGRNPLKSRQSKPPSRKIATDSGKTVDEFMQTLDHPSKDLIEAIRTSILGTDPAIAEGIKWNAPSFRTCEYFATTNLREKKGIRLILHLGAKARDLPPGGIVIDDPAKLLRWLGKDRAMIVFEDVKDLTAKRAAFERILRQWIVYV